MDGPTVPGNAPRRLDCRRPFSFFELVASVWRSPRCDPTPFRRICTLARKQGVTLAILETVSGRADVRDEIDEIDGSFGGGGRGEAVAISFFADIDPHVDVDELANGRFLGQTILVNYMPPNGGAITYVLESMLAAPQGHDPGRTMPAGIDSSRVRRFSCFVEGREFSLEGTYFCQQNYVTRACAHAGLRMAVNALPRPSRLRGADIDELLGSVGGPSTGLSIDQIKTVIDESSGCEAEVFPCRESSDYLRVLASVVESGDIALLVFTTGRPGIEHVVVVLGHALESGEWHPLGLPAYSRRRSERFFASGEWISHFLIHDDGLGPYYSLNARSFELNPKIKAQWIVALRRRRPHFNAPWAQACAIATLGKLLDQSREERPNRWLDTLRTGGFECVLRPVLLSREDYLEHLCGVEAHDGSRIESSEAARMADLPPHLWMVEFTLQQLYDGNRSKLGEVVLNALSNREAVEAALAAGDLGPTLVGFRAPGLIAVPEAGKLRFTASSITSHVATYRYRNREP